MITANKEDYLRCIFCLNEKDVKSVKSIDIASFLKVSKPAVSEMLKKLKNEGYIKMMPYSNITLTVKGMKIGKEITYKHRVAEVFLKETLNLNGKILHEEAHKLEHSLSKEVTKRMERFLKSPSCCPCGHIIPKI